MCSLLLAPASPERRLWADEQGRWVVPGEDGDPLLLAEAGRLSLGQPRLVSTAALAAATLGRRHPPG